jgi:hypothetical protein
MTQRQKIAKCSINRKLIPLLNDICASLSVDGVPEDFVIGSLWDEVYWNISRSLVAEYRSVKNFVHTNFRDEGA